MFSKLFILKNLLQRIQQFGKHFVNLNQVLKIGQDKIFFLGRKIPKNFTKSQKLPLFIRRQIGHCVMDYFLTLELDLMKSRRFAGIDIL